MPLGGPGLACEQCIAKKGAAFGALVCLHGHQQQLSQQRCAPIAPRPYLSQQRCAPLLAHLPLLCCPPPAKPADPLTPQRLIDAAA